MTVTFNIDNEFIDISIPKDTTVEEAIKVFLIRHNILINNIEVLDPDVKELVSESRVIYLRTTNHDILL